MLKKIDDAYMGFLFWATSTKVAAYLLSLLILAAVIMDPPKNIQTALLVVISEYYQGVALPAIGAASKRAEEAAKREGEETRRLLQETHDAVLLELAEMKQMHAELHAKHDALHEKHIDLHTKHTALINTLQRFIEGDKE